MLCDQQKSGLWCKLSRKKVRGKGEKNFIQKSLVYFRLLFCVLLFHTTTIAPEAEGRAFKRGCECQFYDYHAGPTLGAINDLPPSRVRVLVDVS